MDHARTVPVAAELGVRVVTTTSGTTGTPHRWWCGQPTDRAGQLPLARHKRVGVQQRRDLAPQHQAQRQARPHLPPPAAAAQARALAPAAASRLTAAESRHLIDDSVIEGTRLRIENRTTEPSRFSCAAPSPTAEIHSTALRNDTRRARRPTRRPVPRRARAGRREVEESGVRLRLRAEACFDVLIGGV
ncbi:hypothetical protein B4N89_46875 [Embleya scabrispora]|uniref:Uncharacterized protein n=1 Tax=Embleya scabrispora TaxID=159449 RepID=A0A1T3NIC3_9ACTN|nr:hypothetical protein B4N89_46875 [Embleya scabrispora]